MAGVKIVNLGNVHVRRFSPALNVAVTGTRPYAVVDNLNFGNPEKPEIMWQFTETIDGWIEQILQKHLKTSQNNYMFEARLLMKYKDLLGRIGGANVPVTAGVREVTGDYQAEWSTIETELQRILTEDIPAYNRILRDAGLPEIYVPRPIT